MIDVEDEFIKRVNNPSYIEQFAKDRFEDNIENPEKKIDYQDAIRFLLTAFRFLPPSTLYTMTKEAQEKFADKLEKQGFKRLKALDSEIVLQKNSYRVIACTLLRQRVAELVAFEHLSNNFYYASVIVPMSDNGIRFIMFVIDHEIDIMKFVMKAELERRRLVAEWRRRHKTLEGT